VLSSLIRERDLKQPPCPTLVRKDTLIALLRSGVGSAAAHRVVTSQLFGIMLVGHLATWWDGGIQLSGSTHRSTCQRPPPALSMPSAPQPLSLDVGKKELFDTFRLHDKAGPATGSLLARQSNGLAAFNNASALPRTTVDKSPTGSPQRIIAPVRAEDATTMRRDAIEDDIPGFQGLKDRGTRPPPPEHLRPGGVGRRALPELLPFNDGSILQMIAGHRDLSERARADPMVNELGRGSGLQLTAVPRAEHNEAVFNATIGAAKKSAGAFERLMTDSTPFSLNGEAPSAYSDHHHDPRRRSTDVTMVGEDVRRLVERNSDFERRLLEDPPDESKTKWRLGDPEPFRIDFSKARIHENHLDPNQAAWREPDKQPFRIDGSVPRTLEQAVDRANAGAAAPYAGASVNARRYSDMHLNFRPEAAGVGRRYALYRGVHDAESTQLDGQEAHESDGFTFGPLASGPRIGPMRSDIVASGGDVGTWRHCDSPASGLSWRELQRQGVSLKSSASESAMYGVGGRRYR